jgi:hypothetical protein
MLLRATSHDVAIPLMGTSPSWGPVFDPGLMFYGRAFPLPTANTKLPKNRCIVLNLCAAVQTGNG